MKTSTSYIRDLFLARFTVRGERRLAPVAWITAAIFLIAMTAHGWWTIRAARQLADDAARSQISAIGPLLAGSSEALIASGELTALRQSIVESAARLHLSVCRISFSPTRILADANPARITVSSPADAAIPNKQAISPEPQGTVQRFPISLKPTGTAYLEIAAASSTNISLASEIGSGAGVIAALVLCVMLLLYRRERPKFAAVEAIEAALMVVRNGERSSAALTIDPRLGDIAETWNTLLTEADELRRGAATGRALSVAGERRANSGSLEAACGAMSQGLILVDEQMKVRFANGAACSFLKREKDGLSGVAANDLLEEDRYREAIAGIATGKLRRPLTMELERADDIAGGVLRVCVRPVRRGDADAAMIIIEDITQQRMAERARNSFVTQVTHELRTPLTNIRLYTETAIEDGDADPAVRANCLNVINKEARRLERIVSEMLSVAEIEAGSCTIRKDEVYFAALVEELRGDYVAQAAEKQIALEFNLSPKLPKIQADRDKFAIVLHNLLGNALKYTPSGGKVTVTADVKDNALLIDVADTGIGIKPEEVTRVFERFYRSTDQRVGKIVGTGLGLTLAREVMRLHGGDVTVESELNRGSTFTASLPLLADAA